MTDDWTKEIRDRLEKATQSWRIGTPGSAKEGMCAVLHGPRKEAYPVITIDSRWDFSDPAPDAEFIAQCPTDIARLLEEREVLRLALVMAQPDLQNSPGVKKLVSGALAYVPKGVEEK